MTAHCFYLSLLHTSIKKHYTKLYCILLYNRTNFHKILKSSFSQSSTQVQKVSVLNLHFSNAERRVKILKEILSTEGTKVNSLTSLELKSSKSMNFGKILSDEHEFLFSRI